MWKHIIECRPINLLCRRSVAFSSVCGAVTILYYYYFLLSTETGISFQHSTSESTSERLQEESKLCDTQSDKIILYWTSYFGSRDFDDFGAGQIPFSGAHCHREGQPTCLTTFDRNLLNASDAVIFHIYDLSPNDLPPPAFRRPHQNFIFFLYEPPTNTKLDMLGSNQFQNYFNRTMTYRLDSDIVSLHPYGRIKCNDTTSCTHFPRTNSSAVNAFALTTDQQLKRKSQVDPAMLSQKNRTIAWFVSNCHANSKRELLVEKLSLYIPVDVYGPCSSKNLTCTRKQEKECNLMLSRHYRFYLSFENSLCPDYVTEKLYRPMTYDTVPVVFGGSDYSIYLPAGSYINARDFATPLDLANYLKKLMTDDDLYLSYFSWRGHYIIDSSPIEGWCGLCQLLSDTTVKTKTYPNIEAWWDGRLTNKTCFPPPVSLVS